MESKNRSKLESRMRGNGWLIFLVVLGTVASVSAQRLNTVFLSSSVATDNQIFNYRYQVVAPANYNLCQVPTICSASNIGMMSGQLEWIFTQCNFHAFETGPKSGWIHGYDVVPVTQFAHNISLNLYVNPSSAAMPWNSTHLVNMMACLMEKPTYSCLPLEDLEGIRCVREQLDITLNKQSKCFNRGGFIVLMILTAAVGCGILGVLAKFAYSRWFAGGSYDTLN